MPRAIWKGSISFGLVHIPVELYPAEAPQSLHFNLLDKRDFSPVGNERVNKETRKAVPYEKIVKGYEYEDGRYVVLTPEDFKRANVKATQTVDIVSFVDAAEIDLVYYGTPYYLAPSGNKSGKPYALLRETLKKMDKVGIARVVLRTREHVAAVVPRGPALVLCLLRYAHEVRDVDALELPPDGVAAAGLTAKEIEMAERLVEGMIEPWEPEQYHDAYRDDLLKLIKQRAEAGELEGDPSEPEEEAEAKPKRGEVVDLMALLKRSVEAQVKAPPAPAKKKGPARASKAPAAAKTRSRPARARKSG